VDEVFGADFEAARYNFLALFALGAGYATVGMLEIYIKF